MSQSSAEAFRTNLRARMNELGLSPADVADRMGLSRPNIYSYLNGHREPGLSMLDKFAKAVEIESKELIEPAEEKISA